MPQAVWSGRLSFGLVSIPVKLYNATAPKRVRFHQYDAETGRRIRLRRVASGPTAAEPLDSFDAPAAGPSEVAGEAAEPAEVADRADAAEPAARPAPEEWPTPAADEHGAPEPDDEQEVTWERVVKGYEVEPGRVVTVTPDELAAIAPTPSRELEVERFVPLGQIDPVHFDKSYYVVPQRGAAAERPYRLLHQAMAAGAEVAIGRFVMRTKEHLAAVRPGDHLLILETLFYADEVRDPHELWPFGAPEPPEREIEMARRFIEALAADWDPQRHRDQHRERLLELLHSKLGDARTVPAESPAEEAGSVVDLMEALKASVEAARRAKQEARGAC